MRRHALNDEARRATGIVTVKRGQASRVIDSRSYW